MRTRFAPSPTGFLHIGGLRTALYSYLLAKKNNGKFLLRIEDTDQARSVPGTIESILRSLHWAGIDPEEGVVLRQGVVSQEGDKGPYMQSERLPLYRKEADRLLKSGHAYRCFCTPARLEEMRKGQEARKQAPMYDRHCLRLPAEEIERMTQEGMPHVIRLKVPHERTITFQDDIRGTLSFQGHTVDDQVLLKSDGFPTYHLAHVVDDHLMEIDLVLRGEEWLSSLPKHLLLFEALGWPAPRYAHVSLLLNKDKTKLSKRQNAVSVEEYIQKGYLPEALINFIALLGWNPGTEQELFSLPELIDAFSLDRVQKAGAVFDTQKLDWLQGQWIRHLTKDAFAERIRPLVAETIPAAAADSTFAEKAALIQERITFFPEAPDMLKFFYERPKVSVELLANPKQKVSEELLPPIIEFLIEALNSLPSDQWSAERIQSVLQARYAYFIEERKIETEKMNQRQYLWVLRVALTGLPFSPGAFESAAVLGKDEALARLKAAMK